MGVSWVAAALLFIIWLYKSSYKTDNGQQSTPYEWLAADYYFKWFYIGWQPAFLKDKQAFLLSFSRFCRWCVYIFFYTTLKKKKSLIPLTSTQLSTEEGRIQSNVIRVDKSLLLFAF